MAQVTHNVEKLLGYQQPWPGFAIWHWLTMAGVTLDINPAKHKVHTVTSHYISWYFLLVLF